jgi:phosphohistidine phosphatase
VSDLRRTLVLLRHARAEHTDYGSDAARRLSAEGRLQAGETGRTMARAGIVPDVVLCSAAARARETWGIAGLELGGAEVEAVHADELYRAYVPELLDALRAVRPDAATVLVVGHNPTVSATALTLAALGSDGAALARARAGLKTAAYAVLAVDVPWPELRQGKARLTAVVTPGRCWG